MEQFNDLPFDVQSEILNNSKYGRSISKKFNEYDSESFYDKYCQLPISKHEVLNYVKMFNPPYFVLFWIGFHSFVAYVFIWAGKFYRVIEYNYENGPMLLYNRKTTQEYGRINATYYYQNDSNIIVGADLNLTRSIIEQRQQCKNPNYVKDYLIEELKNNLDKNLGLTIRESSANKLFLQIAKNLYLLVNYHIIENGVIEDDLIRNYVNDTVGTNFGYKQNNRADNLTKKYTQDYNFYYESIKEYLDTI